PEAGTGEQGQARRPQHTPVQVDPAGHRRSRRHHLGAQTARVEQRVQRAREEVRPILAQVAALVARPDLATGARARFEQDRVRPAPEQLVRRGKSRDSATDHRNAHRPPAADAATSSDGRGWRGCRPRPPVRRGRRAGRWWGVGGAVGSGSAANAGYEARPGTVTWPCQFLNAFDTPFATASRCFALFPLNAAQDGACLIKLSSSGPSRQPGEPMAQTAMIWRFWNFACSFHIWCPNCTASIIASWKSLKSCPILSQLFWWYL